VTTELGHLGLERSALEEEFLVHGVIMLQTLFSGGTPTSAMQVEKMREAKVNPSLVPYSIDKNGIEAFPNVPLFGEKQSQALEQVLGLRLCCALSPI
jgi:KaiC/GvpD/RAD55 family RecA-like ATPase